MDFSGPGIRRADAAVRPEPGKTCDQGVEHPWAERQEVEFAFAGDVDQAGGFQFFDVMGERGGRNGQCRADLRAAQGAVGFGDAFQEFITLGVGQGLQDGSAAGTG